MPTITGNLRKLKSRMKAPIDYYLHLGEREVLLNEALNKMISLEFMGDIHCIHCGRKTAKSFQQGFCFPCLRRLQECNLCIIYPEKCQVEKGTCPKDDWAHAQCDQPHVVYLANSSGLKVGITRETQVPTRWIDQGAKQAIAIFKTSNRYQAGVIEVALKAFVSDRTNWRAMLKDEVDLIDLVAARDELLSQAEHSLSDVLNQFEAGSITPIVENSVTELMYPVLSYPEKITSLSFEKKPKIEGALQGIKGQYLILDTGVINVRKYSGYSVQCKVEA